jgi:hypothetical protein
MSEHIQHYVCVVCGTPSTESWAGCPSCGSDGTFAKAVDGFLMEFPADSVSCAGCGSNQEGLEFRGWTRLFGFLWWIRELRYGAYLCRQCARTETTKSLFITALLGWWSFPSFFFYGWRATYHNWRSVWAPPAAPHTWGALSAAEFSAEIRAAREQALDEAAEEWLLSETPLRFLNETQLGLVLNAENLYEVLNVHPSSDLDTIRRAYRQRSKEAHPDMHQGGRPSADTMILLNRAWEILRSEEMRSAYDWLESQRQDVVAA